MATIAVVGTLVVDRIRLPNGNETRSLGGLAYVVGALAALAPAGSRILPICRVCEDVAPRLGRSWGRLPGVDLAGLLPHPGRQTRVELAYRAAGAGERDEILHEPLPPLQPDDLETAGGAQFVLVNCISGFDLTLEAMRGLGHGPARVYLDVHSLTLGLHADGTRHPRRPPRAESWIAAADVVQCNEAEVELLLEGGSTPASVPWHRSTRPGLLVVTRGPDGASLWPRRGRPSRIYAPRVERSDPTGAGDTFGAAFVAAWAAGRDWTRSARAAAVAASASCLLAGTEDLDRLPELVRRLARRNPDAVTS